MKLVFSLPISDSKKRRAYDAKKSILMAKNSSRQKFTREFDDDDDQFEDEDDDMSAFPGFGMSNFFGRSSGFPFGGFSTSSTSDPLYGGSWGSSYGVRGGPRSGQSRAPASRSGKGK